MRGSGVRVHADDGWKLIVYRNPQEDTVSGLRTISMAVAISALGLAAIQLVPYGRDHAPPADTGRAARKPRRRTGFRVRAGGF